MKRTFKLNLFISNSVSFPENSPFLKHPVEVGMASAIPEQPRSHLDLIPPLLPLRAWECIFVADSLL